MNRMNTINNLNLKLSQELVQNYEDCSLCILAKLTIWIKDQVVHFEVYIQL